MRFSSFTGASARITASLWLALVLAACGDDEAGVCAPGASVACVGEGGCEGGQACNAEGSGFGECVCDSPDAGRPQGQPDGGTSTSHDGGTDSGMDSGSSIELVDASEAGTDSGSVMNDDAGADAAVGFGSFDCNPLTNLPCDDDQRCAWSEPSGSGVLSCVADGAIAKGDACTRALDGSDGCARGLVCIDAACVEICDFDATTCAPEGYCVAYAGLYQDGDDLLAGACRLGCDPVTQLTTADEACGNDQGCYYSETSPSSTAICASVSVASAARTQDVAITGTVFTNSCAPGFAAITDSAGNDICTALCTPVETWSGSSADIGGAAPHTCASRGAGAGYECRYAWYWAKIDASDPLLSEIGLCVNPAGRLYDSDENEVPDAPWPSCDSLANTDTDDDGIRDHERWGCAPYTR